MTLRQFLAYVIDHRECPKGVHPARWRGMLLWYREQLRLISTEPPRNDVDP